MGRCGLETGIAQRSLNESPDTAVSIAKYDGHVAPKSENSKRFCKSIGRESGIGWRGGQSSGGRVVPRPLTARSDGDMSPSALRPSTLQNRPHSTIISGSKLRERPFDREERAPRRADAAAVFAMPRGLDITLQ